MVILRIAVGTVLFFVCITIYLYGDLAIYEAAVGKSLRDTACTYFPQDVACNETLNGTVACWEGSNLSRDNAYRLFLVCTFLSMIDLELLDTFHIWLTRVFSWL